MLTLKRRKGSNGEVLLYDFSKCTVFDMQVQSVTDDSSPDGAHRNDTPPDG